MERGTRKPLAGISVFLLPQKWKATTDDNGNFEWSEDNNTDLEGEIIINVAGYRKLVQPLLHKKEEKTKEFILYLEKENYRYQETTVTGLRDKKTAQKSLSQNEFLQMPGSNGDPIKAVQNLPGVNRSTGGDSRVVIQGGRPEDTRYHVEGHEVPLVFHFGGVTSIITPEAIESVDYFSAGYGAEWSRALGGHIGLNTRRPKTDRMHGNAFIDPLSSGFLIEGPASEGSSFLATGRVSYIGEVLKAVTKDNEDFNFVVAPTYSDFHAQYENQLNDRDLMRIQTIWSNDELEFVLDKPMGNDPKLRGNFYQNTRFYRIIPSWERKLDGDRRLRLGAAYGVNDITFDLTSNFFRLKNKALSVHGEYKHNLQESWISSYGFDNLYDLYDVASRLPSVANEGGVSNPLASGEFRDVTASGKQSILGVYWSNELRLGSPTIGLPRWTVFPQLRWDRFGPTRENLLLPRISLRYQSTDYEQWRIGGGLYHQLPMPQELNEDYGNPDLKTQRARHYTISWERDYREGASQGSRVSVGAFYKILDRLVTPSFARVNRGGGTVTENFDNKGLGDIRGIETQWRYQSSDWSSVLNYTLLKSVRWNPGGRSLPSPYDQTHSLNLLLGYKWERWNFGGRLRYVTGNPFTPIVGSQFDADNDVFIPARGQIYSERLADFVQLDLRVDRQWVFDTWILAGYLDVQNLTNAKNPEGLSYSYDYSEKQVISGIPVLPTIGIKGEF